MSGPLSSEEIEDVVSSVRRLVSNEQRPRPVSRDLNYERLILTSAERVVAETSPLAPLVLSRQVAEPVVSAEPELLAQVEEVLVGAEMETVWEDKIWPETELPLMEMALEAEEAEVFTVAPDSAAPESVAAFFDPADRGTLGGLAPDEPDEPGWAEEDPVPFIPLRRRAEDLAARLAMAASKAASAEVVQLIVPAAPVADADGLGQADPTAEDLQVPAGALADLSLQAEDADPMLFAPEPAAEDADEDHPYLAEASVDEHDAEVVENGQPGDDPLQDVIQNPVRVPTEILDVDGTPLAVLDEAGLQEIVRMMIREELQGLLGERITHNVRKLVRSEINRALVARDLD